MKIAIDDGAFTPVRAHENDAGLDLMCVDEVTLAPHSFAAVETGVHVEVPKGCVGLLTSKSGLMLKGITCRGTIDCGYTGSIKAVLFNHSDTEVRFKRGNKVVQFVLLPCMLPGVQIVDALDATERGENGFGSTGK